MYKVGTRLHVCSMHLTKKHSYLVYSGIVYGKNTIVTPVFIGMLSLLVGEAQPKGVRLGFTQQALDLISYPYLPYLNPYLIKPKTP